MKFREAVRDATIQAMDNDPTVFQIGGMLAEVPTPLP